MIDPSVGAEQPDNQWWHRFFIDFLESMEAGLRAGQVADFSGNFEIFLVRAARAYLRGEVGPRALAPVLIFMNYGRFVVETKLEPPVERHVLIAISNTILTETMKGSSDLSDRACIGALAATPYKPLMPAWKKLIEYCFFSYKPHLQRLISESTSLQAWEDAIRDIFPYLWLSKIMPIYEREYSDRLTIEDVDTAAIFTNVVDRPTRLYERLFTANELQSHKVEQKMIDEVYAHLSATVGMIRLFGETYLDQFRAEVLQVAKEQGRLAARQKVLSLKSHSLSIPLFFADELIKELSAGVQ